MGRRSLSLCGSVENLFDVIDTTTIENFSRCLSHRITQNVILEGTCCKREYFESDKVKRGEYTYGKKEEN